MKANLICSGAFRDGDGRLPAQRRGRGRALLGYNRFDCGTYTFMDCCNGKYLGLRGIQPIRLLYVYVYGLLQWEIFGPQGESQWEMFGPQWEHSVYFCTAVETPRDGGKTSVEALRMLILWIAVIF